MEVDGECIADAVCGAGTTLTDGMCLPDPNPNPQFVQIEHLARPGINEALLFSNGFMEGYNATAPLFTGVPTDVLNAVIAEAQTVLKALYLGGCLLNGALGLTEGDAGTGVKPAGKGCAEVSNVGATTGTNMFTDGDALSGATLTTATSTAATAYATRVFSQFIPDVMRIDVGVAGNRPVSTYLTVCGDPLQPLPLLCGGRGLRDDTIDITYDYFLNGAGTCGAGLCGSVNQVNALVSDGVVFDTKTVTITSATDGGATQTYVATAHGLAVGNRVTVNGVSVAASTVNGFNGEFTITAADANSFTVASTATVAPGTGGTVTTNISSRGDGVAANSQQGHQNVTNTFPYSATPF
jgi:hypothetical protein